MSSNEKNSEVAVDKVGDEKSGDAKSDLKGAKRAAEVSAHVRLYVFILDARHFIERCYMGHIISGSYCLRNCSTRTTSKCILPLF